MRTKAKYMLHSRLSATSAFDGGLLYIISGYLLKSIRLVVLLLVWKSLLINESDTSGMTLAQVLTYTFLSSILSDQLNIVTPATTDFADVSILFRYLRPLPVLLQFISETIGRWIPSLLLYSIPMILASSLIGINLRPANVINSLWFLISLILAISLGFALDFIFASLVMYMKNASWTAYVIRQAIMVIFSGALIPFKMLPWSIGDILSFLPFGSVAGAPLSIYVGSGNARNLVALQIFWNIVLWLIAIISFRKSEERMVSYGG